MSLITVPKKEPTERVVLSLPTSAAKLLTGYAKYLETENLSEVVNGMIKYVCDKDKGFQTYFNEGGSGEVEKGRNP